MPEKNSRDDRWAAQASAAVAPPLLGAPVGGTTALARRVIAALDVRTNDAGDLVVTKGDGYDVRETAGNKAVRNLGKPVDLCARYYHEGADEICVLNICAFKGEAAGDLPLLGVLRNASERCFVPLTIGGGVRDYAAADGSRVAALDVADAYFRAGADKVGVGSDAVAAALAYYASGASGATSIERIAANYGRQAVVVSLDPRRVWLSGDAAPPDLGGGAPSPKVAVHATARGPDGETRCWYRATTSGGRKDAPICAVAVCAAAEALGAGEFMVNCIDADGKCSGYDLELLKLVKAAVDVPVIASVGRAGHRRARRVDAAATRWIVCRSSGAGKPEHFAEAFRGAGVDAALAAGIFHRKEVSIQDVKAHLLAEGFTVRSEA